MPEPDDELAALRRSDPVDPASLPPVASPQARALFETIVMDEPSTSGSTRPARRRPLRVAAAAAVVAAVVVGAVALTGGDSERSPGEDDVVTGPITPGGPSVGSCVETYDLATLANRELALDGTVKSVKGDSVTLTVNRWFRGGDSDDVTLKGASTLAGITSTGSSVALDTGTRLLVAGDGGFAWACGFSQAYAPEVAANWDRVFDDARYDLDALSADLRAASHRVEAVGANVPAPALLGVAPTVLCVDDNVIDVYEYPTATERAKWAATISSDGSTVGTKGGGEAIVEWAGAPRFYARGRLLVLYLGDQQPVIATLDQVLGPRLNPEVRQGRGTTGRLLCT